MLTIICAAYVAAIIIANSTIAAFGPVVAPINAFVLIGFDLAIRDFLHVRLSRNQMLALIIVGGLASWAVNPAAGVIALASASAFIAAAIVDWAVFGATPGPWLNRSIYSNIAAACVDSLVFSTMAFGLPLNWAILGSMFAAKVAGGLVWALAINRAAKWKPSPDRMKVE